MPDEDLRTQLHAYMHEYILHRGKPVKRRLVLVELQTIWHWSRIQAFAYTFSPERQVLAPPIAP